MLTNREKGLIRALIYPVQFDQTPIESIDRVMRVVIQRKSLNADPKEFSAAIATALKGNEQVSKLVPKSPTEMVVREYLANLQTVMRRDCDIQFYQQTRGKL